MFDFFKRRSRPKFESTPGVVFEVVRQRLIPRLPRNPDGTLRMADGEKYLNPQQLADRFGMDPWDAEQIWVDTFSDLTERDWAETVLPSCGVKFNMCPWEYRVVITPYKMAVGATTRNFEIVIDGTMSPQHRLEACVDQLFRIRENWHGPIAKEFRASFVIDIMRQFYAQGGEAALTALSPTSENAGDPAPAFEVVDGKPLACLTRTRDGEILSAAETADRFGGTEAQWENVWRLTFKFILDDRAKRETEAA